MHAPVDCFVAPVAVPAVEPIRRIPLPPFFWIVLCQLLSSLLCAMWFHSFQSFFFSAFCVDARLTMHKFGASSFAAAIQSLPGGVFRRRQHLTALPGLHLNHLSAKFSQNKPTISAASISPLTPHNQIAFLSFTKYHLARCK